MAEGNKLGKICQICSIAVIAWLTKLLNGIVKMGFGFFIFYAFVFSTDCIGNGHFSWILVFEILKNPVPFEIISVRAGKQILRGAICGPLMVNTCAQVGTVLKRFLFLITPQAWFRESGQEEGFASQSKIQHLLNLKSFYFIHFFHPIFSLFFIPLLF